MSDSNRRARATTWNFSRVYMLSLQRRKWVGEVVLFAKAPRWFTFGTGARLISQLFLKTERPGYCRCQTSSPQGNWRNWTKKMLRRWNGRFLSNTAMEPTSHSGTWIAFSHWIHANSKLRFHTIPNTMKEPLFARRTNGRCTYKVFCFLICNN